MREEERRRRERDPVRCLSCRHEYGKPAHGGTAGRNPGCPRCGYLGWVAASERAGPRRVRYGVPTAAA